MESARRKAVQITDCTIKVAGVRAADARWRHGCPIDKQGEWFFRLLEALRELKKKVVVAGLYNRLEVWDESAWETYKSNTEKNSGDIAEAMADLGV